MKRTLMLCAVVSVACGGNKFTEPSVPQVSGTYGGSAIFSVEIAQARGAQFHSLASCPGTLTIRQSGSQLSGSFVKGPCASEVVSGDVRGTIRSDGGVSFSLTPGQTRIPVTTGCPNVSSPSQYNGVVAGANMQAVLTTVVQCNDGDSIVITERVNGNR